MTQKTKPMEFLGSTVLWIDAEGQANVGLSGSSLTKGIRVATKVTSEAGKEIAGEIRAMTIAKILEPLSDVDVTATVRTKTITFRFDTGSMTVKLERGRVITSYTGSWPHAEMVYPIAMVTSRLVGVVGIEGSSALGWTVTSFDRTGTFKLDLLLDLVINHGGYAHLVPDHGGMVRFVGTRALLADVDSALGHIGVVIETDDMAMLREIEPIIDALGGLLILRRDLAPSEEVRELRESFLTQPHHMVLVSENSEVRRIYRSTDMLMGDGSIVVKYADTHQSPVTAEREERTLFEAALQISGVRTHRQGRQQMLTSKISDLLGSAGVKDAGLLAARIEEMTRSL